jgi:hypothetical protein
MSKTTPRVGPQERRPADTNAAAGFASRSAIAASLSDAEVRKASGTDPGRRFLERIGLRPSSPKTAKRMSLAKATRKAAKLRTTLPTAAPRRALHPMTAVEFALWKSGGPDAVRQYRRTMGE